MVEKTIESLYYSAVVEAVIAKSIMAFPFLGLPVIKQIYSSMVKKIASKIYFEAETLGMFIKIDLTVDNQEREYTEATEELKVVIAKPEATEEEKQKAKDEFKKKLRALIMLNNT